MPIESVFPRLEQLLPHVQKPIQYVGGELNEIAPDRSEIGVWRGVGSVFQILSPAFVDTGLAAAAAAETGADALEVYMGADATGRLSLITPGAATASGEATAASAATLNRTARLVKRPSANTIIVELLV